MNLGYVLSIYIILALLFFLVLRIYGIRPWSSFILAIVTSSIILYLLSINTNLNGNEDWLLAIYVANSAIVIVLILIYIYIKGISDIDNGENSKII